MGHKHYELDPVLKAFWAKSDTEACDWHPLIFHMLDVANVARLIWDNCIGTLARSQIAQALKLTDSACGSFIGWLAGLHDLGKASPPFQRNEPCLASRLAGLGLEFPRHVGAHVHGEITACELRRVLEQVIGSTSPRHTHLTLLVAGHHGTFPSQAVFNKLGSDNLGNVRWKEARLRLAKQLWNLVSEGEGVAHLACLGEAQDALFVPVVAGLTSVSDWIASNKKYFPYDWQTPIPEYSAISHRRACEALSLIGWLPKLSPATPVDFESTFEGLIPNALQRTTIEFVRSASGPYILVIEAQMGSGKTEAALYVADRSLCRREAAGFYIALPTQATSDAMYERVRTTYLDKRGRPGNLNVQLVHGNALLSEILHLTGVGEDAGVTEESVAVESWFTPRKRSLLAPFGVGTIDQSLISVLQTRHWFVRLFGLANKVVVFDEVHAYDTYTTTLLERLIKWLAVVGSTVIVLSATLPRPKLLRLVNAYLGRDESLEECAYPRVTIAAKCLKPASRRVNSIAEPKTYRLEFARSEPDAVVRLVRNRLEERGCGAVVCNTVGRAQQIYERLRLACGDYECTVFHARMPFGWRKEREQTILRKFGKPNRLGETPDRPSRAVVVATQVIEQSLDLDFDWMISDMAPIDLLLQRMGRVNRHIRKDRVFNGDPVLTILADAVGNEVPSFPDSGVYDRYVLLLSWLVVRDLQTVSVPDDVDVLVQRVYSDWQDSWPPGLNDAWREALRESRDAFERQQIEHRLKAKKLLVPEPVALEDVIAELSKELIDEDDPKVHPDVKAVTRLGDPSVQVACLKKECGRLFTVVREVPIDLNAEPTRTQLEALLLSSMPIASRRLYGALRDMSGPPGWRNNPHLRYHRALEFQNGRAQVGDINLELCSVRGLLIHGKEDED